MNALQPIYQLSNPTMLQDFVNALLVEALVPEQCIVDLATVQSELEQYNIDFESLSNVRVLILTDIMPKDSDNGLIL